MTVHDAIIIMKKKKKRCPYDGCVIVVSVKLFRIVRPKRVFYECEKREDIFLSDSAWSLVYIAHP